MAVAQRIDDDLWNAIGKLADKASNKSRRVSRSELVNTALRGVVDACRKSGDNKLWESIPELAPAKPKRKRATASAA